MEELFELRDFDLGGRFGERELFGRRGGGVAADEDDDDEDEYEEESSDILLKSRGYKARCILAAMGACFGSDESESKPTIDMLLYERMFYGIRQL